MSRKKRKTKRSLQKSHFEDLDSALWGSGLGDFIRQDSEVLRLQGLMEEHMIQSPPKALQPEVLGGMEDLPHSSDLGCLALSGWY